MNPVAFTGAELHVLIAAHVEDTYGIKAPLPLSIAYSSFLKKIVWWIGACCLSSHTKWSVENN